MSYELAAENSKNNALKSIEKENFGRAFSHFLVAFVLKPDLKSEFKEEFLTVLCKWGLILQKKNRHKDLFKCYENALEMFPDEVIILNNIGSHLLRFDEFKEAAKCFEKCLLINPYYLRAAQNLEILYNLSIARWHFRMLNDNNRNKKYRDAIVKKIKQGFDRVLDVGTGTGLLSLFCVEAKAKEITACDFSETMIDIAENVFNANGAQEVKLLKKSSTEIRIPGEIPERVSLLVTETFDAGLFGEQILETLSHAWSELLYPPLPELECENSTEFSVVIPHKASLYVAGVEFDQYSNNLHLKPPNFSFSLGECEVLRICDGYDTCNLSRVKFKFLTNVEKILDIHFNDPKEINKLLEEWQKELKLKCLSNGRLDCFVVWFDLYLDEEIVISTSPNSKFNSAWDQAVFPVGRSFLIKENEFIRLNSSILNSVLRLCLCENKSNNMLRFEISDEAVKLLNNEKLVRQLNLISSKFINRSAKVLDCYQFPIFGLKFLIERKYRFKDRLTCISKPSTVSLINFVAQKHEIEVDVLGEDVNVEECLRDSFDVILLDLIEMSGDVKDEVLLQLNYLKTLLSPDGVILPQKVTVIGQFIHSDWLTTASVVINDSVTCGYKIAEFINPYQVSHFKDLDLKCQEIIVCSEPFELFDLLDLTESTYEMSVRRLNSVSVSPNAMVYWLKICFFEGCDDIETKDIDFYNQAAFIFFDKVTSAEINFKVIRNNALFKIELLKN